MITYAAGAETFEDALFRLFHYLRHKTLGVDEFFNLHAVLQLLPRTPEGQNARAKSE